MTDTLVKLALGVMGRLRPRPVTGDATATLALPSPQRQGGMPLMEALASRRSLREFARDPLPLQLLSNLLWAAWGTNRPDGGRTAPSALNVQEIELYAALPAGAIAQNVYLFAAGNGLATVLRAWIDRTAIADALGLTHDQQVLLSQTVGHCKTS